MDLSRKSWHVGRHKRVLAGAALVHDHSQCPHICLLVVAAARTELRAHVQWCTNDGFREVLRALLKPCQAEVTHHDRACIVQKDVQRPDVAVHDALGMDAA